MVNAELKLKPGLALIVNREVSRIEFMVIDSDGSRVSGVEVEVYELVED